jgi:hypothetical protein
MLLEQYKLNEPVKITDRGIYYQQNYNIAGGKSWSNSFSTTLCNHQYQK